PKCGEMILSHRVCPNCGNYNGILIVDSSLNIVLHILSSKEWKDITTTLPSLFSKLIASFSDFSNTLSSSFTSILKA
ncbi:MAG: 50S ribosomal protein L32, partial [bacterium]|nr:50S ribosomal protein L32 [bacterium]